MIGIPGLFAAFAAGLLSFLSPCVLPLVPSYLAMLAGTTVAAVRGGEAEAKHRIIFRSMAFVSGFSAVFILLGLALSRASAMIGGASRTIATIAGVMVILLGLNVAFDFVKLLNREARLHLPGRPDGMASAALFGAAFAAGWSPCVGPMLASILLLAGRGSTVNAAVLLSSYSLGLAVPFIAAAAFFDRLEGALAYMKKRMGAIRLISGGLLIVIGITMLAGDFRLLPGWFARLSYALEGFGEREPSFAKWLFVALYGVIAGLSLRAGIRVGARRKRKPVVLVLSGAFLLLAILEAFGVVNSSGAISAWLRFQGI